MTTYTPEQVKESLKCLEQNGGNVKRTSRKLSIPQTTLRQWARRTEVATLVIDKKDYAQIWGDAQRELVEAALAKKDSASFFDLIRGAGIAADKEVLYSGDGTPNAPQAGIGTMNVQVNYYGRPPEIQDSER